MAVAPFQVSSLSRRVRRPSEGDVLPSSRSACFVCIKRGYRRAATDFPSLQYATSALWARPANAPCAYPPVYSVIGVLAHIFLPIGQMARNSHYYS